MRVLFVSNVFPTPFEPHRAPFNLAMVHNLNADHEVRVVCPIGWTERWWARRTGVAPPAIPPVTYVTYYYVPRGLYWCRGAFMWWSIRAPLRALAAGWRPDVILAYWAHPDGDVARRLALELAVPFVQIVGGSDVTVLARGLRRKKIVRTLVGADAVVTIGKDLGVRVLALGVDAARLVSLYLPVEPGRFAPGPQQLARQKLQLSPQIPLVLWVGRFVRVKALDVLVAAARRLRAEVPDVRLFLIGDGPDVRRIRALVGRAGLDDCVQFVGTVSHDDLAWWYRAADVTVLSSHSEGVPSVLLESMACGTPFVATNVGGVPEIADRSLDRLVPPGDPAALALALAESLRRRAGVARSARTIETPDTFRVRLGSVFERVTAARARQ